MNKASVLKKVIHLLLLAINCTGYAQPLLSYKEIQIIDSVAKTPGNSSYFAGLYIKTMWQIEEQLSGLDPAIQQQIRKLELNFSNYFMQACSIYRDKHVLNKTWDVYFTTPGLSDLQLRLLGINAHINGDLWKALRDSYPANEIKDRGKTVFLFHQSLLIIYDKVYEDAKNANKKLRALHTVTLGLSKKYGRYLLTKWRKRQIRLATLYYSDKEKFERKLKSVENKNDRIDAMIIARL